MDFGRFVATVLCSFVSVLVHGCAYVWFVLVADLNDVGWWKVIRFVNGCCDDCVRVWNWVMSVFWLLLQVIVNDNFLVPCCLVCVLVIYWWLRLGLAPKFGWAHITFWNKKDGTGRVVTYSLNLDYFLDIINKK